MEWNKEYRRIYARKLRGTVSEADWQEWRGSILTGSAGAPRSWVPFDSWKHQRNVAAIKSAIEGAIKSTYKGDTDGDR